MILNTLTAHLASSIIPPNKTAMALRNSTHYLAAYLAANQCHTAVLIKSLPLNRLKLLLGQLNNLAVLYLHMNKEDRPIDPYVDLVALCLLVFKPQTNKI
jgi:hypothetical protein